MPDKDCEQLRFFHVKQRDTTDCGAACLLTALRMYGGNTTLDRLRELSGTGTTGVTMLGLKQAAEAVGMIADGYEASLEDLKKIGLPSILHVTGDQDVPHFILAWEYLEAESQFLVSDPSRRTAGHLSPSEISNIWKGQLLTLKIHHPEDLLVDDPPGGKLKWILSFVKSDLNLLFSACGIGLIISILGLSVAIFSQVLIDSILVQGTFNILLWGCILLALVLLMKTGLTYLRELFLRRQLKDFNIRLIEYFYGALISLPKPFFDRRNTGDLTARMNDTSRIQQTISMVISSLTIDLMVVLAVTIVLFTYHPLVGLLSLLWLPLFYIISSKFHQAILSGQRHVMVGHAMNESNYIDTIQGIETIKGFRREGFFKKITGQIYREFQEAIFRLGLISLRFNITIEVIGVIFYVGMIMFSAILVMRGNITLGAIVAVIQMIGMIMSSGSRLFLTNIELQEARVAYDRMQEYALMHDDLPGEVLPPEKIKSLNVDSVAFRYTGRPMLFENVNLQISRGEQIAIIGESGCGKSTLLQILMGFYKPEEGEIFINGDRVLSDMKRDNWLDAVASVPQQLKMFGGTVHHNIAITDDEKITEKVEEFLKNTGFLALFDSFPYGLMTPLGETGVNISGGQQQLVAIARALYSGPQVLLLDEATSFMDRNTENRVLNVLKEKSPEMLTIFATHQIKIASKCTRIYVLENGTVTIGGTHEELMKTDNYYSQSFHELQI